MSYESFRTDNPVLDAERWASREDPRPLLGRCEICGCEIRGGTAEYDPDDAYEFDNEYVCSDHLEEYFKDNKLK